HAHVGQLSTGVWQALVCAAAGLAVAIPTHAGYNYLVSRVNSIVLDMERDAVCGRVLFAGDFPDARLADLHARRSHSASRGGRSGRNRQTDRIGGRGRQWTSLFRESADRGPRADSAAAAGKRALF